MQCYLQELSREGIAGLRAASSSHEAEKMDVQRSWERWGVWGGGCRCFIPLPVPPQCHPAQLVQRGHPVGTE